MTFIAWNKRSGPSLAYIRCTIHSHLVTTHSVTLAARPYDVRGFPLAAVNRFGLPEPAWAVEKEAAFSRECQDRLKQIGIAARLFALDNNDFLPSSFAEMADTLDSLYLLVCPSDLLRTPAANLAELSASNITYRIEAPGVKGGILPSQPFVSCPLHGHHLESACGTSLI